jgi:hypothetical protein
MSSFVGQAVGFETDSREDEFTLGLPIRTNAPLEQ